MKISSIKETCIYVTNLEVTKRFYEEILKLKLISFVPGRHVFFRVGNQVLLCFNSEATKVETHVPPHFAYGNQHLAFEVEKEEYEQWKELLASKGIAITHEHHWKEDLYSFYFNDPDNHVLEIVMPGIWE